ncbi:hypothetical protein KVT40_007422 [Elsinoe batatas]|uniref:Acyltransferase 3 domain-containing protein n=1 Tax=Elsinoe batatas TaxID=2601811 RepID=A0A8K0KYR0_9PEZI|nr:hypothetical protein KVT40_007422 [Elsinoe batatas]
MLGTVLDELKLSAPSSQSRNPSRAQTAWLDGLRGYAALLVFFCHFGIVYWNNLRYAYGTVIPVHSIIPNGTYYPGGQPIWNGTNVTALEPYRHTYPIQLPIIRILTDGDPMVVIFFLVSGYSLSLKPTSLIGNGPSSHSHLLTTLSSSVFRRPIRLLLPILASTLLVVFAVTIGLYTHASTFASSSRTFHLYFHGWAFEATPHVLPSLNLQLIDWLYSLYDLLDFFTHFHWTMTRYDIHLWTIPVELRCSLLLFLTHLALAPLHVRARLSLLTISILLALTWGDTWEMALFWTGQLLCEIDFIHPPSPTLVTNKRHVAALGVALYLLSTPMVWAHCTPFYRPLTWVWIPGLRPNEASRFWQCLGATGLMVLVARVPVLRGFFSNGLARYLGRISFALYLVHGPVLRSLGYSLAFKLWQVVGREGWRYHFCVCLTGMVVGPVTIGVANVFCRRVDEPVVRLARWVEGWMKGEGEEDGEEGGWGWQVDERLEEQRWLQGHRRGDSGISTEEVELGRVGRGSLS